MNERDQMLDEMGLAPLWVRRELLVAVPAAPAPAPSTAPGATAHSNRPRPASRPATVIPPVDSPPSAEAQTSATPDARSQAIAKLEWDELQAAVRECTACGLCQSRLQTVFGIGEPQADWLVVGEAPGAEEDRKGEPFVGQAGKLLDNMLAAVGRSRHDNVYILNTLKCRPPQNRNPDPAELAQCAPFLHRQIALIRPKVILASGRFAVQALLDKDASISSLRGRVHDYRGIPVVVTYHPAYLLRNLPDKYKAWGDLLLAQRALRDREAGSAVAVEQMQQR